MKNTIIIPDVHGRSFWKDAIPYVKGGTPCIFLGDYIDPYEFENISSLDSYNNLYKILAFAREYRDRVTLLLGNHDLSYLGDPMGIWSVFANRFCYEYADIISEDLNDNIDLLSLCTSRVIGGKQFLFSHAGIHPVWLAWCNLLDDDALAQDASRLAERINSLFRQSFYAGERTEFMEALAMVSSFRGGDAPIGSMVWADADEFADVNRTYTQIFGHTMQLDDSGNSAPLRIGNNICVDCQCCFYLDHEGILRHLDGALKE